MPIYEFYCRDCHAVFSFLASRVDTRKRPACPDCRRPGLERRPSRFAISRGRGEAEAEDRSGVDPAALERGLEDLAREADGLDQEDPRRMARLVRRLYETSGLPVGPGLDEAMRRMEAGEDPDAIEAELGAVLEGEDPLSEGAGAAIRRLRRRLRPPRIDDTLHRL